MLVQRCTLERHRLIIPVSVTKPLFEQGNFQTSFSQHQYRALVDTGAQRTVLSKSVIAEQKLMRTGHMEFASLHGPQTHSRYLAGLGLWVRRIDKNDVSADFSQAEVSLFTLAQPFEIVDMTDNLNFDLILGFDVLKEFSFSFDYTGQSFEIVAKG